MNNNLKETKRVKGPKPNTGEAGWVKRPVSPVGKGTMNTGEAMRNTVPAVPVPPAPAMKHTALTPDGKGTRSAARHLPKFVKTEASAPFA